MLTIVIIFLWASVLLYFLLGGADFGAGILELFSGRGERTITRQLSFKAIGPIWEANHMWLIITVVILFVGFPAIYTTVSTYLHIPLLILLLGIIARGTALSFRTNDAVKDDLQRVYSRVFVAASVVAPFFLGVIGGSMVGGTIDPAANSFRMVYLYSWLRWFPLAAGLFTACLCAWLASIYMISVSENDNERKAFIDRAAIAHFFVMVSGILLVVAAEAQNATFITWITGNIVSLAAAWAACVAYLLICWLLLNRAAHFLNALAVLMVTMLFLSVTYGFFPNVVLLKNGMTFTLTGPASGQSISVLGWSLLLGSLLIFPALFYLIYIFEEQKKEPGL